jgi:hypothetical protein
MAVFKSRRVVVERAMVSALATGLAAAGQQYATRVRQRLAEGYTSGDFTTGHVAASVEVTPVRPIPQGLRVSVGSNVNYALFWEVGHVNIFARGNAPASSLLGQRVTGTWQRVEIWRPFLLDMSATLRETIRRIARQQIHSMTGTAESGVDAVTGQTRAEKRAGIGRLVSGA